MSRQIALDTETTGMGAAQHRIIEIGCVPLQARRIGTDVLHHYYNPERSVDDGAFRVHGLSNTFLADKPLFAQQAQVLLDYLTGAELIIHNAPFDVGFLDAEFARVIPGYTQLADYCAITDTLTMARQRHPGQKNSLDALCKRYDVDNSHRDLHGALVDAKILALVYLHMTGGQESLFADGDTLDKPVVAASTAMPQQQHVVRADAAEVAAHEAWLARFEKA